jgi:prepilin-type N-terminal cleavage/methylation domain-containing protein/prepilin-type processing-associated H-X9-DG protein
MDGQRLRARSGFTIIELIVALAILGLLAAVLVPAVQSVRATARQSTCQNNLHQWGTAWQAALQSRGAFPTSIEKGDRPYQSLLPYLDQVDLGRRLNANEIPDSLPDLEVCLCPDDSVVWGSQIGNTSYFLNEGTYFRNGPRGYNGFSSGSRKDTRPQEITDGLSQTAAMCERLVRHDGAWTDQEMRTHAKRFFVLTPRQYTVHGDEGATAAMCRDEATGFYSTWGLYTSFWLPVSGGYDHMLTPNQSGCLNGTLSQFNPEVFLASATSLHAGGVNCLYADGRVAFTSETIDANVWKAVGSRNGGTSQ